MYVFYKNYWFFCFFCKKCLIQLLLCPILSSFCYSLGTFIYLQKFLKFAAFTSSLPIGRGHIYWVTVKCAKIKNRSYFRQARSCFNFVEVKSGRIFIIVNNIFVLSI
jgi:hypothetical protein